jgi:hypothetical protein
MFRVVFGAKGLYFSPRFASITVGVGHPVNAMPDDGRAEARSRGSTRPEGVTDPFHVSLYKVDPSTSVCTLNLFAKDKLRAALADEVVEGGPKVPLVSKPFPFACRAERLARA